jgi:DNA polymerase-1
VTNAKYLSILEEIKQKGGDSASETANDKVLIIDGLNTFIRCFSAIPTLNDDGAHVGGIVGFLRSIGYAIRTIRPTRTVIVFDGKGGSNRRKKVFPQYKAGRNMSERLNRSYDFNNKEDEHESMIMQLTRVIDYLDYLPVTTITIENIEADDTMAYVTKQILKTSKIVLMSTDKDFLQLVNHRVSVWSPTKKKMYDPPKVLEDYGIPSHNFAVYRSIDGDKSDNINGVRGWGLKTIQKKIPLLLEDKILNIDDIIKEDEKLKENEEILRRNYRLMQLEEVDISTSAKTKILDKIREPINRLNKMQFQKKFIEDRLFATLPNMESWLVQCFAKLNQMAEGTYGKKEKV